MIYQKATVQKLPMYPSYAISLPVLVENGNNSEEPSGNLSVDGITTDDTSERSFMTNAREKAQASTQVNQ